MARIAERPGRARPPKEVFIRDRRGVVYVEFLLAFIPLFLLFLGTCQLALLNAARLMVVEKDQLVGIIALKDMLEFLSLKVELDI